jgi:hypothetical protein
MMNIYDKLKYLSVLSLIFIWQILTQQWPKIARYLILFANPFRKGNNKIIAFIFCVRTWELTVHRNQIGITIKEVKEIFHRAAPFCNFRVVQNVRT